jgi:hypothetical protein
MTVPPFGINFPSLLDPLFFRSDLASPPMAVSASLDVIVLALGIVLAALYLFRDQVFSSSPKPKATLLPAKEANGHGDPRDFVAKMKAGVRRFVYLDT